MRPLRNLLIVMMLTGFSLAGCQSMTGKTAGRNVDDATLTSSVKTKLAADKLSSMTRIDVRYKQWHGCSQRRRRVPGAESASSGTRLTGKRCRQGGEQPPSPKEVTNYSSLQAAAVGQAESGLDCGGRVLCRDGGRITLVPC